MAILLTIGMEVELAIPLALRLLLLPFLGCSILGLPAALLVFKFVQELNLQKLLLFANSIGAALAIVVTLVGGGFAAFFYGLPILISANAFAIFGWHLIIKPSHGANLA